MNYKLVKVAAASVVAAFMMVATAANAQDAHGMDHQYNGVGNGHNPDFVPPGQNPDFVPPGQASHNGNGTGKGVGNNPDFVPPGQSNGTVNNGHGHGSVVIPPGQANGGQGGQGGVGNGYGYGYGGNPVANGGNPVANGGSATASGTVNSTVNSANTATGQGGSAQSVGQGGNVNFRQDNDTRIYNPAQAPNLYGNVQGNCMALEGLSLSGFFAALGMQKSNFNEQCAALEASKLFMSAGIRVNDPNFMATAIQTLRESNVHVNEAVMKVLVRIDAMRTENRRPVSAFDLLPR